MSATAASASGERADASAWLAVAAGTIGSFMATLDISIVNAALPTIQGEVGASGTEGTWISTAFLVSEIVMIPLTGWFVRTLGLRTFLLICATLFTAFSVMCGLADSLAMMIAGRIGQGFAGGALIPTALTIVGTRLPPAQQPLGTALFGMTVILGPVIGPLLGGWLTENVSWHYAFFINVPICAGLVALLLLGLLMVYSASIALADGPRYASYGRYYFVIRHGLFVSAGLLAGAVVLAIPIRVWQRLAVPLFMVSIALLVAVLIPGIGREVNGAHRWIPLGPLNFQPSELMKLAALLYAADYTVRKQEHMQAFARGFLPMAFALAGVGMLLLLEPDLGAFMVIVAIAIGILFLGGINGKYFSSLLAVLVGTFLMLIWLSPWRRARLFAYLDPWNEDNAYGSAYQLSHSLIALGRGEWLGVGLGASVEKLHYLPEAHTDFLMAVVGEELGFVGVMTVITLFAIIIYRGFDIGRQAIAMERTFAGLVAHGVAMWFGVQSFINMGVCLGLLPTKGLTLPLMSYGGSGVVMNLCALAMLIRVDVENRIMMRGGRV